MDYNGILPQVVLNTFIPEYLTVKTEEEKRKINKLVAEAIAIYYPNSSTMRKICYKEYVAHKILPSMLEHLLGRYISADEEGRADLDKKAKEMISKRFSDPGMMTVCFDIYRELKKEILESSNTIELSKEKISNHIAGLERKLELSKTGSFQ